MSFNNIVQYLFFILFIFNENGLYTVFIKSYIYYFLSARSTVKLYGTYFVKYLLLLA